jgi:cytochrome P450
MKTTILLISVLILSLIYLAGDEEMPPETALPYLSWITFLFLCIVSRTFYAIKNYYTDIKGVPCMPYTKSTSWLGRLFGYSNGFTDCLTPNERHNNHQVMAEMFEETGPLVQCSVYGKHMLLVDDPVTAKDILHNCSDKFQTSSTAACSNIFTSDGKEAAKRRQVIASAFEHTAMNANNVGQAVAKQVGTLCDELNAEVDEVVPLDSLFSVMALDVLLKISFGIDGLEELGYNQQGREEVIETMQIVLKSIKNKAHGGRFIFDVMCKFPVVALTIFAPVLFLFPNTKAELQCFSRFQVLLERIYEHLLLADAIGSGFVQDSIPSKFIRLNEQSYINRQNLLSEIGVQLVHGVAPVAHTLTFFFYCLASFDGGQGLNVCRNAMQTQHDRLYDEDGQATTESIADEVASYVKAGTTLPAMIEACLKESMRLFPVSGTGLLRQVKSKGGFSAQTSSGENIEIPHNCLVMMHVYSLHRNHVWENPDSWMPDRWLSDEIRSVSEAKQELDSKQQNVLTNATAYEGCGIRQNELSFLPFGYGPRSCMGMHVALLEMRIAIATILLSGFSFELADEVNSAPSKVAESDFLLKPVGGLPVRVRKISH